MTRRSLVFVVFAPIVIYLVAMLALAGFYLHPPTLGWIGLSVLSVVGLLAAALAVRLLPRMGTNAARLHPREGLVYRLAIVADTGVEPAELRSAARLRVIGRRAEVRVVTPVVASPLHFLAADEDRERGQAERRLQTTLRVLAEAGIPAEGVVGTDDPLQAAADLLARFPADEILFVGSLAASRGWLDRDFERRARDLLGVPVSTVFGSEGAAELALAG